MRAHALAAVVALAVLLGACGGDGGPSSFDADPGEIDAALVAALPDGADPAAVPVVQRNFLEGCVLGAGEGLPELDQLQLGGLLEVCGCGYASLVDHLRSEALLAADADAPAEQVEAMAFDRFEELDESLRNGDGSVDDVVAELFRACIRSRSVVSS